MTRYQILLFLLEHSPCNQMAVQERLKIDQAALTRHFKILETEGLVERHRNPENQREVLVGGCEVCQGAVSGESPSATYQG